VLIGDSHLKGIAAILQAELTSKYELFSVVKPGACSNQLVHSIPETVKQLTKEDVLVISYGTNDYGYDNFKSTIMNIKDYISTQSHTNILVLGIPFRYDLQNSIAVNLEITKINRMLSKIVRTLPNCRFLETNNDSKLFTRHGLHRNKLGKQLMVLQINTHTCSFFRSNTQSCIPLAWHNPVNSMIPMKTTKELQKDKPDENQRQNFRNSNRTRKIPVTRSDDFLW